MPLSDNGACSPPNPPPPSSAANGYTGGPYIRDVSDCGFTAGWAFVSVDCGYDVTSSNDAGYLYFEVRGNGGQLTEGGYQYNSDSSVAPYLRVNGTFTTMTNNAVRYGCGQILGLVHGFTSDGNMTFTETGQLPAGQNPEAVWINHQTVTLNNPSYLFAQSAGGATFGGTDPAGNSTPCTGCSVSKMTTIGQNQVPDGQGYNADGSAFGIDPYGEVNHIQWLQVAFGEWLSNCMPNTTLCSFVSGADPDTYFSTTENFPDPLTAQQNPINDLGYGPYQTFDGILLPGGGFAAKIRKPAGAFTAPFAPLPCTADASGLCAIAQKSVKNAYTCETPAVGHRPPSYVYSYTTTWSVYKKSSPPHYLETTVSVEHRAAHPPCPVSYSWTPGDPKVQYNDPNGNLP